MRVKYRAIFILALFVLVFWGFEIVLDHMLYDGALRKLLIADTGGELVLRFMFLGGFLVLGIFVASILSRDETASQNLKESEDKFAKAFRSSPNLMLITRMKDGLIVDASDSFVDSLGYSRSELIGRTTIELGIWEDPEERKQVLRLFRENNRVRDFQGRIRKKSGEVFFAQLSAESVEINDQPHLITLGKDITDKVQA